MPAAASAASSKSAGGKPQMLPMRSGQGSDAPKLSRQERIEAMRERQKNDKGPSWTELAKSAASSAGGGAGGGKGTGAKPNAAGEGAKKAQMPGGIDPQQIAEHLKNRERPVDADQIIALLQELAPEFVIPIRIGLKVLRVNERRVIDAAWPEEDLVPLRKPWRLWIIVADIAFRLVLFCLLSMLVQLIPIFIFWFIVIAGVCKFNIVSLPICPSINQFLGSILPSGSTAPLATPAVNAVQPPVVASGYILSEGRR
jgi:hypothetical protein